MKKFVKPEIEVVELSLDSDAVVASGCAGNCFTVCTDKCKDVCKPYCEVVTY